MSNRITGQFTRGSQHASGCTCGWPVCVAIFDEVVTPNLKRKPGYMVVDRWFDCIRCGPWVHRLQMPVRTHESGAFVIRGSTLPLDFRAEAGIVYPWTMELPGGF